MYRIFETTGSFYEFTFNLPCFYKKQADLFGDDIFYLWSIDSIVVPFFSET